MKKKLISAALVLAVSVCAPISAYAAVPDSYAAIKGAAAAEGTFIDMESYADGSIYENPPSQVKTVRIGLRYGDRAVQEAEFINCAGGGFYIGAYNADREFVQQSQVDDSAIIVSISGDSGAWHILLDAVYETQAKAENAALAYGGFVQEIDGAYRVLYGTYDSRSEAERIRDKYRLPGSAYTAQSGSIRIISAIDSSVLYSAGTDENSVALLPVSGDEKGLAQYKDNRYYGGFECGIFDQTRLSVINCVELEDYVKGVIPYEMSYVWPYEALRAQAVCARTYVVYNQNKYESYGFDLTDNTESQVYRGTLEANETTDMAVDSTAGQLVRYKGEICEVYYFASDGGATEDGAIVFDSDRPYLQGKIDPFEQAVDYDIKDWTAWRTGEDMSWQLQNKGYDTGEIVSVEPEYSDTGNVTAMSFRDTEGGCLRLEGRACYTSIGLNSCRFTVEQDGEDFRFSGDGWGHSCGMSQWGANAMASVYGYN